MDTVRFLGESVGIWDPAPAEVIEQDEITEKDHDTVYDGIPISEILGTQEDANGGVDSELEQLKEQRRQILQLIQEESEPHKENESKSSEEQPAHAEHENFLVQAKHEVAHLLHLDGKGQEPQQEEQESAGKDQWYLWNANDRENTEREERMEELAAVEEAHRVQHWHLEAADNSLEAASPEVETPVRRKRISFADEAVRKPPQDSYEAISLQVETPVKETSFASNYDLFSPRSAMSSTTTSTLFRSSRTSRSLLSPDEKTSLMFRKEERLSLLPPDLAAAIDKIAHSDGL